MITSISIVLIVAIVAFATWELGLLERPTFVMDEKLLGGHELHAIMATSREHNIGQHVDRLIEGTKKGVVEGVDNGTAMMEAAAKLYGSPKGAPGVHTGLYFDNPSVTENPRWAIGWAVEGKNFKDIQAMIPKIQEASGLDDPIKVVRIGGKDTHIFTAKIPWRNLLTPMVAPMLHWRRGFQAYEKYIDENPSEQGGVPIALEVYVTGPNDTRQHIDYILLFGGVETTWQDTFPTTPDTEFETKKEEFNVDDTEEPPKVGTMDEGEEGATAAE